MTNKLIVPIRERANYDLKKTTKACGKVIIVFTDEEIIATFDTLKDADLYCFIQNGYFKDQVYFSDEINVVDFNKSILN